MREDARWLRWTAVGLSPVPLLAVFGAGSLWKVDFRRWPKPRGQPPSWFFGLIWTVVLVTWGLSWAAAAAYHDVWALVLVTVLLVGAMLVAVAWQRRAALKGPKDRVLPQLLALLGALLVLALPALALGSEDRREGAAAATLLLPGVLWAGYATQLNLRIAN